MTNNCTYLCPYILNDAWFEAVYKDGSAMFKRCPNAAECQEGSNCLNPTVNIGSFNGKTIITFVFGRFLNPQEMSPSINPQWIGKDLFTCCEDFSHVSDEPVYLHNPPKPTPMPTDSYEHFTPHCGDDKPTLVK